MFRGSAPTKIDDKGRLKLPRDFRRNFEERYGTEVFITSVRGDSALFYPLPVWEELESRLVSLPWTHQARQRYLQRVSYFGQQGRLDSQGRVLMPQILRESAQMVGEVVVCGNLDHLEVWNRQIFEKRLSEDPFTNDDYQSLTDVGI